MCYKNCMRPIVTIIMIDDNGNSKYYKFIILSERDK